MASSEYTATETRWVCSCGKKGGYGPHAEYRAAAHRISKCALRFTGKPVTTVEARTVNVFAEVEAARVREHARFEAKNAKRRERPIGAR